MAKPLPRSLDLLQPTEKPTSTWNRIYEWVFNVGRYVIIAVELIVLIAFVMRFALDRRSIDLNDEIEVKMNMLDSQRETEQKVRRVQQTLNNFSELIDDQILLSGKYQQIMSEIPNDITWDNFGLTDERIAFEGRAPSYEDMEAFERTLRENPDYDNVDLEISKSGSAESEVDYKLAVYFAQDDE
jgi:hypothetical protein